LSVLFVPLRGQNTNSYTFELMLEVSFAGEDHREAIFTTVVNKNYFAVRDVS